MGKIFANRIVADPENWTFERVPLAYRKATEDALRAKADAGTITRERLAEILGE